GDHLCRRIDPAADARPGWVAAWVLRKMVERRRNEAYRAAHDHEGDEYQLGVARGMRDMCDELTAIADNAGDAEAVERAAFELVEERLREALPVHGAVHFDGPEIRMSEWRNTAVELTKCDALYDAYRALAGKGGEGDADG